MLFHLVSKNMGFCHLSFCSIKNPITILTIHFLSRLLCPKVLGTMACRCLRLHWTPQKPRQGGATRPRFVPRTLDTWSLHEASQRESGPKLFLSEKLMGKKTAGSEVVSSFRSVSRFLQRSSLFGFLTSVFFKSVFIHVIVVVGKV